MEEEKLRADRYPRETKMASDKHGDQNPTIDTPSEADSGRGTSVADAATPDREARMPIEKSPLPKGPNTEFAIKQESERSRPFLYKHLRHDGEPTATGDQQQNFEGGDTLSRFHLEEPLPGNQVLQAASTVPQKGRRFSYSRREDVPKEMLDETKKRGEGKSDPVKAFWYTVSNHLREFEEVVDFNLLLLQNGVLITSSEVTSQDLTGPTVQLKFEVSLQKFGKTNPAAFLQLTDCPQVCKPFGLILDEEGECVYFLMERLRGETLKRMLNSGDEIPISEAVSICIEILQALLYIHSKGMVHRDVKASNVMSDGTNATLLDITGVRKADRYSQFAQDTVMAVNLLNKMLLPPDSRSEGAVWTPSDEQQKDYGQQMMRNLHKAQLNREALHLLLTARVYRPHFPIKMS